ncbi:hypothetical protein AB9T88_05920 [Flavobacterium sp. LBUM151]
MTRYLISAFSTACLAYSLYFIFATIYRQPIGASTLADGYFYGFVLHVPAWLMAFLIIGLLNQKIASIKYLNQIIKLTMLGVITLLLIPIFDDNSREKFEYLVLPFYILDFLLSSVIFVKLLVREKSRVKDID